MEIHGLPETFWIVDSPSAGSELGDICYESDLARFALQIRGGLNEDTIVGVFAEKEPAVELAERLLATVQLPIEDEDVRVHQSPWPDWFATQESLAGVFLCDKASDERMFIAPPKEWDRNWAWNLTEDGTGIVLHRGRKRMY
jgi:hypothetical protein